MIFQILFKLRSNSANTVVSPMSSAKIPTILAIAPSFGLCALARLASMSVAVHPRKGQFSDDILYNRIDAPTVYTHPLCLNTWRNGKKIGEEAVVDGY